MLALRIILGATLLITGRKMFWFFIAATGFAAGMTASDLAGIGPGSGGMIVGLVLGALGALLAILFQRAAVAVAGLVSGAFVAFRVAIGLGVATGSGMALIVAGGGIVGIILMTLVFEGALIGLSSLAGSALVVEGLALQGFIAKAAFVVLFLVGISLQSAWGTRSRRAKNEPRERVT